MRSDNGRVSAEWKMGMKQGERVNRAVEPIGGTSKEEQSGEGQEVEVRGQLGKKG